MNNKLYVGNLAFSVTNESLSSAFSAFGTVDSAKIITDRDTGRSKGFGFVEMSSAEEGAKAIAQLNGTSIDGRAINVSEAKPMAPREDRGGGGGGGFFGNRR